jgi:hypothetical protein
MKQILFIIFILLVAVSLSSAQTLISSVNKTVTGYALNDTTVINLSVVKPFKVLARYESGTDTLYCARENDTLKSQILFMLTPTSRTYASPGIIQGKFIRTWSSSGAIVRSIFIQ